MTAHQAPPVKRSRRPPLSAEDKALWEHVAGTVRKSPSAKPRVPHISSADAGNGLDEALGGLEQRLKSETSSLAETSTSTTNHTGKRAPAPTVAVPHPPHHRTPPLADFDRKTVRRIRSGRIEIEARLDLHGMQQDEAHRALRSFLGGCQSRGQRWVLVITGKGRATGNGDGAAGMPIYASAERGILRKCVPRWLSEPNLRPLVVSYTTAALHHGGEGALYIQLRAPRGERHR